MPDLRAQLAAITDNFVSSVLAAVQGATIADVASGGTASRGTATPSAKKVRRAGKDRGRKPRPVPAPEAKPSKAAPAKPKRASAPAAKTTAKLNVSAVRDQVLAYVRAHPNERSEKIRAALKLERAPYLRATAELLESKKIVKKGERRKTSFSAAA